jgi:hypothetical protein
MTKPNLANAFASLNEQLSTWRERADKAEALAAQEHEKAEGYRLSQEGIVAEVVKERKRAEANADKALANLESGVHWNARAVAAEAREITLKSERDQARAERDEARLQLRAADKVMELIDARVQRGQISSRCELTDARQDYSEPLTYQAKENSGINALRGQLSTARTALTTIAATNYQVEAGKIAADALAALTSLPGQPEPEVDDKAIREVIEARAAVRRHVQLFADEEFDLAFVIDFMGREFTRIRRALSDLLSLTEREPVLLFVKAPDEAGVRKAVEVLREAQAALGRPAAAK